MCLKCNEDFKINEGNDNDEPTDNHLTPIENPNETTDARKADEEIKQETLEIPIEIKPDAQKINELKIDITKILSKEDLVQINLFLKNSLQTPKPDKLPLVNDVITPNIDTTGDKEISTNQVPEEKKITESLQIVPDQANTQEEALPEVHWSERKSISSHSLHQEHESAVIENQDQESSETDVLEPTQPELLEPMQPELLDEALNYMGEFDDGALIQIEEAEQLNEVKSITPAPSSNDTNHEMEIEQPDDPVPPELSTHEQTESLSVIRDLRMCDVQRQFVIELNRNEISASSFELKPVSAKNPELGIFFKETPRTFSNI
jgi:hypothetical protein